MQAEPISFRGGGKSESSPAPWQREREKLNPVGEYLNPPKGPVPLSPLIRNRATQIKRKKEGSTPSFFVWSSNSFTPIIYYYDANGKLFGLKYNGTDYFYVRNVQGDIIKIMDVNGDTQVQYNYDAWGYIQSVTGNLAATLGQANPYRYRGYRYDNETGLYYLQSRYYNSGWGRFINADDTSTIGASPMDLTDRNLFTYCDNNPVVRADDSGQFWNVLIGAFIGGAVGFLGSVITQALTTGHVNVNVALVNGAAGAVAGALAATGVGLVGQMVGNAAISAGEYAAEQKVTGKGITGSGLLLSAGIGALSGRIGGAGLNGAKKIGIYKASTQALKTAVSPKKIAMYTAKKVQVVKDVAKTASRFVLGSAYQFTLSTGIGVGSR